ncbi:MAG TPA: TetR/AcrR family transcriptional regulator [Jatrophihabitantaceae bacterium]|nr:TetR/AcrR family transcriptional regulator [Jatrophihabitantaceae bacterium]
MVYRRTPGVQARLDAQRARLVAAATQQLAEQGYAGCSVAAVARRAGVASGTVYNHFDGKAELVAEVFCTLVSREVAAVRTAVEAADDTTTRVTAFAETFALRALKSPRLAFALLAEPVDPAIEELRLAFRVAFRDIAATAIAAGVSAGELPAQDARVVAAAIVGAIGEALVGPLSGTPDPAVVATLVAFALRSLGVRHAVHAVHT